MSHWFALGNRLRDTSLFIGILQSSSNLADLPENYHFAKVPAVEFQQRLLVLADFDIFPTSFSHGFSIFPLNNSLFFGIWELFASSYVSQNRILEGVRAKNLQATLQFVDFTKAFDSIHRGKMEQILLAYGLPKETVAAIKILYRNTKVKVR